MAYVFINSFKEGIDARRNKISGRQGSLISGSNVHINRGGEIEKRKAFVAIGDLPSGITFGLHATKFGIYTFGSTPAIQVPVPANVIYQQLVAPGTPAMTEVVSVDSFNSVPYVVARFDNGGVHHFYNGKRVTDWDILSPKISNLTTLCESMRDMLDTDSKVSATYAKISGVHTITITAEQPNTKVSINTSVQNITGRLFNTIAVTITQAASATLAQTAKIEISGINVSTSLPSEEVDAADVWAVNIGGQKLYKFSGASSGVGSSAKTFRGKIYATVQGLLYYCGILTPERWTPTYTNAAGQKVDTFAGFESLSAQTGGTENLVVTAPYQNFLACFARRSTQIWQVVPGDPVDNQPQQILENVGTMAARSAISFGELDVFFLSDSGIRSLRARDSSNAATVFDVGTSIDPVVVRHLSAVGDSVAVKACGVIEPQDGRYMLAIGNLIFVYSFYPASKISAWTTYDPGFSVTDWAVYGNLLYCRAGDTIYALGGTSGENYDDCLAEVELSWLDAEKPGHKKGFKGIDVSCQGTWDIGYSVDPFAPGYAAAGSVSDQNFSLPHFRLSGHGTHIGFKFSSQDPGPVGISSVCVHFDFQDPPR